MQIQMTVHDYAGSGADRTSVLTESSAQFAKRLIGAGYHGDAWHIADKLDMGELVYVKEFRISAQKLQHLPEL